MRHESFGINGEQKMLRDESFQSTNKTNSPEHIADLVEHETALIEALRKADFPTDERTCQVILDKLDSGLSYQHVLAMTKLIKEKGPTQH